jgi:hypothetical protein
MIIIIIMLSPLKGASTRGTLLILLENRSAHRRLELRKGQAYFQLVVYKLFDGPIKELPRLTFTVGQAGQNPPSGNSPRSPTPPTMGEPEEEEVDPEAITDVEEEEEEEPPGATTTLTDEEKIVGYPIGRQNTRWEPLTPEEIAERSLGTHEVVVEVAPPAVDSEVGKTALTEPTAILPQRDEEPDGELEDGELPQEAAGDGEAQPLPPVEQMQEA